MPLEEGTQDTEHGLVLMEGRFFHVVIERTRNMFLPHIRGLCFGRETRDIDTPEGLALSTYNGLALGTDAFGRTATTSSR